MIKGKNINLRLVRGVEEYRELIDAYNDLSQRAETDHTEVKPIQPLLDGFIQHGLWGESDGKMLVVDKDDTILGDISFTQRSEFDLEVGFRLLRKEYRGRGVMSEALTLFSACLFETKPIQRLTIRTADDNLPSRKLAEKCGYKQEGVLRQAYFYRGRMHDFVIYGLLREECPPFSTLLED